jgi:hypothetical protein
MIYRRFAARFRFERTLLSEEYFCDKYYYILRTELGYVDVTLHEE